MRYSKPSNLKFAAIVLGVIAASVPVLFFNSWLRNQGEDEATVAAAWALGYAETQIGQAATAVKELSANGVDSCRPAQVEAMRRAVLRAGPFKELMLIGQNGQLACTDSGVQTRQHVIASVATADREIMLELVRIGEAGDRLLRVRKVEQADKPSIAAVIPAGLLLPQVSMRGGRLKGPIRLIMPGGAEITEAGTDAAAQEQHHARLRSQPYGLIVAASMPANGLVADQDALRRIGMLVTGLIAIVILLSAVRRAKRPYGGTAELAKAILAEEFVPYYQPVVDIQTGKLLGAEVLVRWKRADGSFIEPAAFVALIESSGLSLDLTRSLMRRVRDDVGSAIGSRPHVTVAFNVAPQHFDYPATGEGAAAERQRLDTALAAVRADIEALIARSEASALREIFLTHLEMLEDPDLQQGIAARLKANASAAAAWDAQIEEAASQQEALHDKLLADRESLALRRNVTNETDVGRFRLIDPPVAPRSPAAPNRLLLLLGVALFGLGIGNATSLFGVALAFSQGWLMPLTAAVVIFIVALPMMRAILLIYTLLPMAQGRAPACHAAQAFRASSAGIATVSLRREAGGAIRDAMGR